ncbi:MAG: hypothetical protein A3C90_01335 [Candidatus Magasanikbacteria bacterium RIFCSPHIGHO2_02_FULL_51_14]|uniref:DUF4012 domain-containing protein n=1 Tax=Candidatus Magasanikbacteria bacterium RIFCSPHIGHO2_02_FULL_51_14 TaxID=1798683 RepID=A0A1F6MD77_9BACT|nr:MAG: hypothetical protein A3C90_01335 [Candidatus Magasanikbacteria bacterium RIFCSPHIGHO2_02_FULL_51_14]
MQEVLKTAGVPARPKKRSATKSRVRPSAKKRVQGQPPVVVRVVSDSSASRHVVDLKQDEREKALADVNVFHEKPYAPPQRVTVDFAALVRASQKSKVISHKSKVISPNSGIGHWKRKTNYPPQAGRPYSAVGWRPFVSPITYHLSAIRYALHSTASLMRDRTSVWMRNSRQMFSLKRLAYATVALFLIAALPFPAIGYYYKVKDDSRRVVEESANAFLALQSSTFAALQSNIPQAQYDLNAALQSFDAASSIVEREHKALVYVMSLLPVIGNQVLSRQHLLSAGHHLALGNASLVRGITAVENSDETLPGRLAILRAHVESAIPQYEEALAQLSGVAERDVPVEYQQSFGEFRLLFAAFINDMHDLVDLSSAFESLLGSEELKRYLIVFQNQNELRPTGGFMGSFATLDVQKGRVLALDVPPGGTYDLQGQLDVFVKPPLPLQAVNARWEFQDANWFPDFPLSAQKIEWFYRHGRGATVDGVIAINASVLERVLGVVGPIIVEDRGLVIAADDAIEILQQEVETGADKIAGKPKAVIGDILSRVISRLGSLEPAETIRLLGEVRDALEQKEIQAYVHDPHLYQTLRDFGWTGDVASVPPRQDYLMVVAANIHGQKSDAKIEQQVEHQAVVQDDGSVIDTVFIKRHHTGTLGEPFSGTPNVSYVRVYAPDGAELLDAGGFTFPPEDVFKTPEAWYEDDVDLAGLEREVGVHPGSGTRITREFDKIAFGNWMIVGPGDTVEAYVTYRLPFAVFSGEGSRYSLLVQKQSGTASAFRSAVIYPDGWHPAWRSRDDLDLASNGAAFETALATDEVFGVVMEKIEE